MGFVNAGRTRHDGGRIGSRRGSLGLTLLVIGVIALVIGYQFWSWFFCRIEIEPGWVGILIAKTGENLPSGQIIATDSRYKGIQLQVLPEGRHFYDPIFYDWELSHMIEIPNKHLGVVLRWYGREFSEEEVKAGKVIADPDQKGVQRDVLLPGRYRINRYAEEIEPHPAVEVPAGYVGIVTNLGGMDSLASETTPEGGEEAAFLVGKGRKGVSRDVLTPGTHYLNPYLFRVDLMDCRSHRFELVGDDALRFPSSDAFEITVLMTLEWAIDPARAPEIFVRIGEMHADNEKNELLQKVIVPAIRGFGRIEGSKYSALDYIAGVSRQVFQNTLFEKIKQTCEPKGILIKSVLINDIEPPQDIAKPIREREIAKEELSRNKSQLLQAKAEQSLARSEELAKFEREKVTATTGNKVLVIDAKNRLQVAVINQDRRLQMERVLLEASRREAEAIVSRGKASADVITLQANAEADALRKSIDAFKTPENLAYFEFVNRLAPSISSIFANTDGVFGRIFGQLLPRDLPKGGTR